MDELELVIAGRDRDLGGFHVRRVLPFGPHRMVGPFIFFDHMGPTVLGPGEGMDVRPHPHVNLATVTYLFEGKIRHRDSLGSDCLIEPGAVNWMTAGRGIVHSERSPADVRAKGGALNGIQCWVALPAEHEETVPSFAHHPASTLPEFKEGDVELKLLLGEAYGRRSPVAVLSDLFYLQAKCPKGARLTLKSQGRECAVYVASGGALVDGQKIEPFSMAVGKGDSDLDIEALEESCLMLLGGTPVGERFIFWNFVSSSKERLEEAKAQWARGPGALGSRFGTIPGDDKDFIPLPVESRS